MATTEPREVSYAELIGIKNRHIEVLQHRKTVLADAFTSFRQHPSRASLSLAFLTELLDDVIVDACFEIHRKAKSDTPLCHVCRQQCDAVAIGELSVSGPFPDQPAFDCDHCQTQRCTASRYATHLENCMGFGRRSRRNNAASNASTVMVDADGSGAGDNDDDDDDFGRSYGADGKKRKKAVKGKLPKRPKKDAPVSSPDASGLAAASKSPIGKKATARTQAGGTPVDPETLVRRSAAMLVQSRSQSELRALFESSCGVLSVSTGKPCNKSLRCSIHTDEQRQLVRSLCLQDFHQPQADNVIDTGDTGTIEYDLGAFNGTAADYASTDALSPSTLAEVNEYIDIESDGER